MIYLSDSALIKPTHMQSVFIADQPITVEPYQSIADAYDMICEYEDSGQLIIRRYDTLSEDDLNDIHNKVMLSILKEKLLSRNDEKVSFIKEIFPDAWERAIQEAK